MTAAQPNNLTHLAGTLNDDAAAAQAARPEAEQQVEQQPEYVGDMPDDPEQARTYRSDDDQPAEDTP